MPQIKPTQAEYWDFDFDAIDYFVVGVSGGKDSTALLLWLVKEFFPANNISPDKLIATFADTKWEAWQTYEYVHRISKEIHPVIWLESEGVLELSRRKQRFPSTKARFCTQELKLEPAKIFMEKLAGKILSLNGMRRDESKNRSKLNFFGEWMETYHGFPEWRPLLDWKVEDVFLFHRKHNFTRNPLYDLGFERVGCMPCIMSTKGEIRLMASLFPERVNLIRDAENNMTGFNGFNSFFHKKTVPLRYRSKAIKTKAGTTEMVPTIDDVVAWSRTADHKRSSQYSFHFEDYEHDQPEDEKLCLSGVCE